MKKQLLKLLKNLVLLLLVLFFFDRVIGAIVGYFYKKETRGDSSKTTYAVTRVREDILIFGSSRAAHHYIADEIEKSTGLSCFNVGRDGMKLSYYNALLKAILSYHTPKAIILDLNFNDFSLIEGKQTAVISTLLPYIDDNIAIEEIILKEAPLEVWKSKISKLYRYNSLPVSIVQHHMGVGQKHQNGYEPLKGNKLKIRSSTIINNSKYSEDKMLVQQFEAFVRAIKERDIELYVMVSPCISKPKRNCLITANRILNKYGMRVYDYSNLLSMKDIKLFYDGTHMNDSGANYFTRVIVKETIQESSKLAVKKNNQPFNTR